MTKNYKRDFFAEAHTLLKSQSHKNYIENLLPSGKWKGSEYEVKNPTRNDNRTGSFSVNSNGKWNDFASGDGGSDLIGLTEYIKGISAVEACFYVGVPRPEKSNTKTTPQTDIKPITEPQLIVKQEHTLIDDEAMLELEQEAIESEGREPAKEKGGGLKKPVPEFTADNIGKHNATKFKGGKVSYYRYYNSNNTPVGCVVRCDREDEGKKVKLFTQYCYDIEKGTWRAGWGGVAKPLYNLKEILERKTATVMIVEGEKTAEAARLLFPSYVVTTCSMGASSPSSSNWGFLKNRDVIISPDNDKAGAKFARSVNDLLENIGVNSIKGLDAKKLGRFTIQDGKPKHRNEPVPEKYDIADSAKDGWTAELIEAHKESKEFAPFFEVIKNVHSIRELPKEGEEHLNIAGTNYKLSKKTNTLYWEKVKTDGRSGETTTTWLELSGYIKPIYCIKDENGDYGVLVDIVTRQGEKVECFFSRQDTATPIDTIKILLQKGLAIPSLKLGYYYLISFLNNFKPEKRAVGVDSVGWQGANNNTYILPFSGELRNNYANKKEGEEKVEYILQSKSISSRSLTKKGTLKEWRRTVGEVTRNNDLHTFSILAALTAPALKILNEEGGFIHYVGDTSIGKSTILHVAKSVWGFDDLGSFRITDNALESVCKDSNDGAIFLDEIGEVEAEAFFKIIYMLANGATKGRLNKNADAKKTTFFTVLAQSTGEIGLEAKLAEKRIQAKGGQLMRMAELDADRGKGFYTFDVLNTNPDTKEKFKDGKTQAEYLKYNAQENCGVVIDEFIKNIFNIGVEKYAEDLKTKKEEWLEAKLAGNKEVEVARMAKRFSTIFASGALAVFFGIIPHTVEEVQACVNSMFQNWLERRGGDTPYELKIMIAHLYKLCKRNQYSRFQPANPKIDEKFYYPADKAGYWKTKTSTNDKGRDIDVLDEFWIAPRVFDAEVLTGRDSKSFLPLLVKYGYLKKGTDGKYSQVQRPKNEKNQRFYIIPASAFNSLEVGEDENEPTEGKNEREKYSVFKPA